MDFVFTNNKVPILADFMSFTTYFSDYKGHLSVFHYVQIKLLLFIYLVLAVTIFTQIARDSYPNAPPAYAVTVLRVSRRLVIIFVMEPFL